MQKKNYTRFMRKYFLAHFGKTEVLQNTSQVRLSITRFQIR